MSSNPEWENTEQVDPEWLTGVTASDFSAPANHLYEHMLPERAESMPAYSGRHIDSLYLAIAASDGDVNPVVILTNDRIERAFVAEDDDTLGTFLARLAQSRRAINAHRLFFARAMDVGVGSDPCEKIVHGVMWVGIEKEGDLPFQLATGVIELEDGRPVGTRTSPILLGDLRDLLLGMFDQ